MPYFRFSIDNGASDDQIVNAPDLRTAWKQLPDRFEDDELLELCVEFQDTVEMPEGFEDETQQGGEEEGG